MDMGEAGPRVGAALALGLMLAFPAPVGARVLYVRTDSVAPRDGLSWEHGFADLRSALAAARTNDEIWVSAGTYCPFVKTVSDTFALKPFVALYGGFAGGETNRNQRNWVENVTILSGDRLQNDQGRTNNSENVNNVVTGCDHAVFDGFTVQGGNARNTQYHGGGMFNYRAALTVRNCVFRHNSGENGGGMANWESSPVIENCVFYDNYGGFGGGMENYLSSPSMADCVFRANLSSRGGGFYGEQTTSTLSRCSFIGNAARLEGGGVYIHASGMAAMDCVFTDNSGGRGAGLYHSSRSSLRLHGSVFSGNTADTYAGALYSGYLSSQDVWQCTFLANRANGNAGGAMQNESSAFSTVSNSIFVANRAPFAGAVYELFSAASLRDCVFAGNTATAGSGGAFIFSGSGHAVALDRCVFVDNTAATYGGGVRNEVPNATVARCTFAGNRGATGGAICTWMAPAAIENCLFAGNAGGDGAALAGVNAEVVASNCTLADNSASGHGGVHNYYSPLTLQNCILWANSASQGGNEVWNTSSPLALAFSSIAGGWDGPGVFNDAVSSSTDEGGNIGSDPLFEPPLSGAWTHAPVYWPQRYQTGLRDAAAAWSPGTLKGMCLQKDDADPLQTVIADNDSDTVFVWGDLSGASLSGTSYRIRSYRVRTTSPCVDAGTNLASVVTDLNGVPRPLDGDHDGVPIHDMGAFERVDALADSDGDGMTDADELLIGTGPTSNTSVLALNAQCEADSTIRLSWCGGISATQHVEFCADLRRRPQVWTRVHASDPASPGPPGFQVAPGTNGMGFFRVAVGK